MMNIEYLKLKGNVIFIHKELLQEDMNYKMVQKIKSFFLNSYCLDMSKNTTYYIRNVGQISLIVLLMIEEFGFQIEMFDLNEFI